MQQLSQKDKDKISETLHNNWDLVFKFLMDSAVDEDGIPYREVYKCELVYREKNLPCIIDICLKSYVFFDRDSLRNWIIEDIIGDVLGYSVCGRLKLFQCVNQLYDLLFPIIKPYYLNLFSEKEDSDYCEVIETNISMKDGQVCDHQARVLEIGSWNNYVQIYKEYDGFPVDRFKQLSNMNGNSIPGDIEIENLKYDENHLSCDFKFKNGRVDKRLAYKCLLR